MASITPSYTSSRSRTSSSSKYGAVASGSRGQITVKTSSGPHRESPSPRASLTPQAPERPAETLKAAVGDKVRRSRCAPDFLHEVAMAKRAQPDLFENMGRKFKILTGKEAIGYYKRFLMGKDATPNKETEMSSPVVFAVSVSDAGRKLVDYYLTWRGQRRARELRGSKRQADFLDSDFRKVARTLDKEYRRTSVYGSVASVAGSVKSDSTEIEKPSENTRPRPRIIVPLRDEKTKSSPDVPPQPSSATDSVTSLPVLSYVRGVPFGNRMHLTVTNPDRLSMLSTDSVPNVLVANTVPPSPALASVPEEPATDPTPFPPLVTVSPPDRTETPSSRSTSPQSEASANAPSAKDASSENVHTTRKTKDDAKLNDETPSEFLIVLLDEMIDKDNPTWHGLERQTSRSSARSIQSRISPWDGPLARANGVTYRTAPLRRVSSNKANVGGADDSSSSEEEWENEPVIPLEPFVPSLSETPPPRHGSPAPMNMNMQYGLGGMPTMSPYASPMMSVHSLNTGYPSVSAYGSPYVQAQANLPPMVNSPYVSPYMSPNLPLQKSLSQVTYMGYNSPYVS